MKSLDTNVLVRLLLADDAAQLTQVKTLLSTHQYFTSPITVMQELVWVLEAHDYNAAQVQHGLNLLLSLPNFKPAHLAELRQAIAWYALGMDFADALHLALRGESPQLLTFDKGFIKQGRKQGLNTQGVDWVAGVATL
jgi:predicted nucleic-acid-binding protein